ncbi:MAG TPA: sugar transferase [Chthoniobacterales bacterium]|nr:sugar transferase [Chthoniobacterales bacterium]
MIRLLNAYFPARTVFLGVSEACLIALAFMAATIARLGSNDATLMLSYEQGFFKILIVAGAFIVCMYYFDLYDSSILKNRREVVTRLIQVLGTATIVLAVLYYAYPPLELGRGIFLIGVVFAALTLFLWRRAFLFIITVPRFADRALIFGDGALAAPLLHEFTSRPELGLRVVGQFLATEEVDNGNVFAFPAVGQPTAALAEHELWRVVQSQRVNHIIVAMNDRRGRLPVGLLLQLKSRGVLVQDGTVVYEAVTGKVPIESLRLDSLLFSEGFQASSLHLAYNRFISISIAAIGLLLAIPLFPFVALAIKLTSAGPIFYQQKRVGRDGTVFDCFKLRTMSVDAEADTGPTWALDDDPRITRVGRFLRTVRLDEIPQLWNVLKGDMSLVGPRPERPEFVDWLNQEIPHYHLRHTIRPGITGWAQVRHEYGSSVEHSREKLRYDLFYIKNMSPGLDLLILFQTIKTILLGRGAK